MEKVDSCNTICYSLIKRLTIVAYIPAGIILEGKKQRLPYRTYVESVLQMPEYKDDGWKQGGNDGEEKYNVESE